jgi:uncharacterized protein (TIGR02145 family)
MNPNLPKIKPISSPFRFAWIAGGISLFFSCQSSVTESDSSLPKTVTASITYVDSWKRPDSLTWSLDGAAEQVVQSQEITSTKIVGTMLLAPGSKDIYLGTWAGGMRFSTIKFRQEGSASSLLFVSTDPDSIALALLERLPSGSPRIKDTLVAFYANRLLNHDAAFQGFPKNCPKGLDSAAVVHAGLLQALGAGVPVKYMAQSWMLGIDASQAETWLRSQVTMGILHDSNLVRAFPPFPVRTKETLNVPDLEPGIAYAVKGAFVGDSGLSRIGWKVSQAKADRSEAFDLSYSAQVDGTQKSWSLEVDAKMKIRSSNALPGTYELIVWMIDPNGNADTLHATFQVLSLADKIGPQITVLSPSPDTILGNTDSLLLVAVRAVDPSGIDSVVIQGVRVDSVGGVYSRRVPVPATGASTPIRVAAFDKKGNRTDSFVRAARMPESGLISPRLTRISPAQQTGNNLSLTDSVITVVFAANSPNGLADTAIRIGGRPARRISDTSWSLDVPVPANGFETTIPVDLVDKKGVRSSDWVKATRSKDATGPVVEWTSPSTDTVVSNSTSTVAIRFQAKDISGVDSVLANGRKPDALGNGAYLILCDILPSGKPTPILVRAWDRFGNESQSTLNITRKAPLVASPPRVRLVAPSLNRGNKLAAEIDSIKVSWIVASDLGLFDSSVKIAGAKALRENDSIWTTRIGVPGNGLEIAIPLLVVDAGGQEARDTVWVTRAKFVPRPVLTFGFDSTKGDPPLRSGAYATQADSLDLPWSIVGECIGCEVRIDGRLVDLSGSRAHAKVAIPMGLSFHGAIVSFDGQVVGKDSVSIHRYPKLSLRRTLPVSDTLDFLATSVEVGWAATNAATVRIDGVLQTISVNGTYSQKLSNLKAGANTTRLVATDSLGNIDSSVVTLVKVPRVDLSVVPDKAGDQWDSASCTISSLTAGASLSWSTDSLSWSPVPADGRVWIRRTGRVHARGTAGQFLTANVSSPAISIRHTNTAPSFQRMLSDTIKVLEDAKPFRAIWATAISMGGIWDSSQLGRFAILPNEGSTSLFAAQPAIDSVTGVLTFTVKPDAFGLAKFKVVLRDNGGSENWGVDSSTTHAMVVSIASVNDAPVLTENQVVNAKISTAASKLSPPQAHGYEGSQLVYYSFSPMNALATSCFVQPPKIDIGMYRSLEFTTDPTCAGGLALFRMIVKDDGGTANGGIDSLVGVLSINLVDTIQDSIGNPYHYRKLGGNVWLMENLGSTCATCSPAGSAIAQVKAATACPTGWRLPTAAEWQNLVTWAAAGKSDTVGANHLKSITGWSGRTTLGQTYEYNGDNSTGFNLVPSVYIDQKYSGYNIGNYWTSTADTPVANFYQSFSLGAVPSDFSGPKMTGPVRCVAK